MLRYNTEIKKFEGYTTTGWNSLGKNFTLSNFNSNSTITNNIISKVSGGNVWNASVHSNESYTGSAYIKFKLLKVNNYIMVGFNIDPLTDATNN